MKILLTGSEGFIGKNLKFCLHRAGFEVLGFDKHNSSELSSLIAKADFIIHLAGVNRPLDNAEFYDVNLNLTKQIIDLIKQSNKETPIIFASSTQAGLNNDYGKSKKMAEDNLLNSGLPVYIYRLANVFGKWCRPNYNSVCATYCFNIAHDLPIEIRDPNYVVSFNYVDDVCKEFIRLITNNKTISRGISFIEPTYECSLQILAKLIENFKKSIEGSSHLPDIHGDFEFNLFETFCDYFSDDNHLFNYIEDNRGSFREIFKSSKYGQISVNEIIPGLTKGGHYHTHKKEIFMTIQGKTTTRLRKIGTLKIIELITEGNESRKINIEPMHTHDIKNIGTNYSKTIMWSSEVFNEKTVDTIREGVDQR